MRREECGDCIHYKKCKDELAERGLDLYRGALTCARYRPEIELTDEKAETGKADEFLKELWQACAEYIAECFDDKAPMAQSAKYQLEEFKNRNREQEKEIIEELRKNHMNKAADLITALIKANREKDKRLQEAQEQIMRLQK